MSSKEYSNYGEERVRVSLPGLDEIEQQVIAVGALAVFRAMQNDLAVAFDDLAVGTDGRLTFFRKPNQKNVVPLLRLQVETDGIALDLDPVVVLRRMGIAENTMDELLALLPTPRTDLGGRRLRVPFTDPSEVQALATFLMRRFNA